MKKTIFLSGLLCVFAASGYTAAPSEFPGAFVKQAQVVVDDAVESVKDLDALSSIITPIAAMSNYASLKTVRSNLAELERMTMSEGSNEHIDAIRLAGLYKLTVPLVLKMNDRILDILSHIEELLSFWKEAQGYRVQFFLHRKSPKVIIHTLQRMHGELCALLGTLVQQINKAPFEHNRAVQYAWFKELCAQLNSDEASVSIAMAQPVFETVAAMLTRATSFVLGFNNQMEKRLYQYGKPSWLRRNLGTTLTTLAGGAALGVSADKCRDGNGDRYVQKAAITVVQHADTYRKACADALWGDDKKWDDKISGEERQATRDYKLLVSRILPSFSSSEQERDQIAQDVINQRLRDLNVLSDSDADLDNFSPVQIKADGHITLNRSPGRPLASRTSQGAGATADDQLTDLERVFGALFGIPLPQPKNSSERVRARRGAHLSESASALRDSSDSSGHTVRAMSEAASTMDIHYLGGLIAEPIGVEGQQVKDAFERSMVIVGKTDLGKGNNLKGMLNEAFPKVFSAPSKGAFTYSGYEQAVGAIAGEFKGNVGIVDTIAQAPEVFILAARITQIKAERKYYELWKKMKLLVMIGISYFLYRVGTDVVAPPVSYALKKMRIITYPYEGVFETLRELKKLLLVNGEKQQAEMDTCDVGLMYYLIYRLECVQVPAKYSTTFLHDVRLLQSPDLSAKQKYKVVKDVLQDGYPFLRPTGVTTK